MTNKPIKPKVITEFASLLGWSRLGLFYIKSPDNQWSKVYLDRLHRERPHDLTFQISEGYVNGDFVYYVAVYAMKFGVASGHYPLPLTNSVMKNSVLAEKCRELLSRENFLSKRRVEEYVTLFPEVYLMTEYLKTRNWLCELPHRTAKIPDLLRALL